MAQKVLGFCISIMSTKSILLFMVVRKERNMRGGTENVYGIVGLAKAMEIAYRDMEEHQNHIQGLKDRMISKVESQS